MHVAGSILAPAADVVVSEAAASASFPQRTVCGDLAQRAVSGDATIARVGIPGPKHPVTAGFVGIPAAGGTAATSANSLARASSSRGTGAR